MNQEFREQELGIKSHGPIVIEFEKDKKVRKKGQSQSTKQLRSIEAKKLKK